MTEKGFQLMTENGLQPLTENGFQPTTENGFQLMTGNGVQPMTENGFQPITEIEIIRSVSLSCSEIGGNFTETIKQCFFLNHNSQLFEKIENHQRTYRKYRTVLMLYNMFSS